MQLSKGLELWFHIKDAICLAFLPTLRAIWEDPSLLLKPRAIRSIAFTHIWKELGPGLDGNTREVKEALLREHAHGVVLDIGAGHGHTALYLDPIKVTKYVALEPNSLMHPIIRTTAAGAGFSEAAGTLLILPYGAQDLALILSGLGGAHTVDTLVSILTLCCVPSPKRTLEALVDGTLHPGGSFVFYEHVKSQRKDVAWWQSFWTPVWSTVLDGCMLDRETDVWVKEMDVWEGGDVWGEEGEDEEHMFWHQMGRFVKKGN